MEVQHIAGNCVNGQEIVPSDPYDSPMLVLNHAPFLRSEENGLEEEPKEQAVKSDQVCNEE